MVVHTKECLLSKNWFFCSTRLENIEWTWSSLFDDSSLKCRLYLLYIDAYANAKRVFQQVSYPVPKIEIESSNGKYSVKEQIITS